MQKYGVELWELIKTLKQLKTQPDLFMFRTETKCLYSIGECETLLKKTVMAVI